MLCPGVSWRFHSPHRQAGVWQSNILRPTASLYISRSVTVTCMPEWLRSQIYGKPEQRGIYRPVLISVAFGTYTFTYAISKPTSQALCLQRTGLLATAQLINVVTKQLQVMTCELHFAVMKRQKPIISCPSSDIDCSLV